MKIRTIKTTLCMLGLASVATVGSAALSSAPSAQAAAEKKGKAGAMKMDSKMSTQELIESATSAAPAHIGRNAKVVMVHADSSMMTVREGSNDFTCMADAPDTPGPDPMCADKAGWTWITSWMKKDARPANTEPGLIYMLKGGSDLSATDPWATSTDRYIESGPHIMLMWAFDAKKTGLPTKPQKTGTWIMWAGTPYAHLMINGNPFEGKEVSALEQK